ncbi:MAG TPA: molybdate ABC transporter substrate-binding protein [Candidatus Methylomirabilis sp.]|nr:molybdate ABC transporter substrate-binding protein [Candidatus Methylomirabilis sp.]
MRRRAVIRVLGLAALGPVVARAAGGEPLRVLAAVTLKPALDEVCREYERGGRGDVKVVYGPTPTLARQIENGIEADVFFAADDHWMDYLESRGHIRRESRLDFLGNRLVLIAYRDSAIDVRIAPGFPLGAVLDRGPLAMCDPDSHPAGRLARESLERLGVWPTVSGRVAKVRDVVAAVSLVADREAPLAVVFATDARLDGRVRVVDAFPDSSHSRISYPVAITSASVNPAGPDFLRLLRSPAAIAVFEARGYLVRP